jgi:hypothetical protein
VARDGAHRVEDLRVGHGLAAVGGAEELGLDHLAALLEALGGGAGGGGVELRRGRRGGDRRDTAERDADEAANGPADGRAGGRHMWLLGGWPGRDFTARSNGD